MMRLLPRPIRMSAGFYAQTVALIMFALLVVAFSIDLLASRAELAEMAQAQERALLPLTLHHLSLRAVDIVTRLLPMACFVGCFIAEQLRRARRESTVIAAHGGGPMLVLGAVMAFSLPLGAVQGALEGWLRPLAIQAQVELGTSKYARWYGAIPTDRIWISEGDQIMGARIQRSDPVMLRDLIVIHRGAQGGLEQVTTAPHAQAQGERWQLQEPQHWTKAPAPDLPISPLVARYFDVDGFNLPSPVLSQLAGVQHAETQNSAKMGQMRRLTAPLLPFVCALLGMTLAQWLGRIMWPSALRIAGVAVFGYFQIVSIKIFWAFGDMGALGPLAACVIPLGVICALCLAMQIRLALRA
jgi:lipopolysaccharide export LptBFGC system permease protein LptF